MSHELPLITSLPYQPAIAIRPAGEQDRAAVERLAALDSAVAPAGTVLLGAVDGEPWAALSVDDGHAVADPFRRSSGVVDLLRASLGSPRTTSRRERPLLAPRWAA